MQSYTVQEPTVQVPRGAAGAATGACCCCCCCSAAAAPPGSTRRVARLLCSPARPLPARPLLARPALARPALARPALLGRRSLARRSLTRPPPRFQRLGRLGYDGLRALGQHRTPTSVASVATVSAGTRWTCEVSKRAWVVSATQRSRERRQSEVAGAGGPSAAGQQTQHSTVHRRRGHSKERGGLTDEASDRNRECTECGASNRGGVPARSATARQARPCAWSHKAALLSLTVTI